MNYMMLVSSLKSGSYLNREIDSLCHIKTTIKINVLLESDTLNKLHNYKVSSIIIANIIFVVSTTLMLTSCDTGGEDDGTVGNWFMAIVCLLAWLKGGK